MPGLVSKNRVKSVKTNKASLRFKHTAELKRPENMCVFCADFEIVAH